MRAYVDVPFDFPSMTIVALRVRCDTGSVRRLLLSATLGVMVVNAVGCGANADAMASSDKEQRTFIMVDS